MDDTTEALVNFVTELVRIILLEDNLSDDGYIRLQEAQKNFNTDLEKLT